MYKYRLINNHYVVEIDDKKYLIDTGSPISFWTNNPSREIVIDGISYPLFVKPNSLDIYETINCIGEDIDGFIGLDIINQTSLTIYKNGYIDFSALYEKGEIVQINIVGSYLLLKVESNHIQGHLIIDTGAKYGYGVKSLFEGKEPFNHVEDYNPMLKQLSSDIYHLSIIVGGQEKTIDICKNPCVERLLLGMSVILIANITSLFDEVCVIDTKKRIMIIR